MTDKRQTHVQLLAELTQLRERVTELETAQAARQQAESQREAALAALRDSQARLQRAGSVAHFGNWELNLTERRIRASANASAIYGLPGEEWPLAEVQSLPLPEYRARLDTALANLIEHQQPYEVEFRIRRPSDGQLRDIQSIAEYDAAQRVVFGAIHDITARKQAESQREAALEALLASEEKYRNLVKYAPAVIYEMDLQGTKFLSVNEVMCDILGYSREELLSMKPNDLLDPDSRSLFKERILKNLAGEKIDETIEYRIRRKDGGWIDTALNVRAFPYTHEKSPKVVVIAHDITRRKRAEEALRASEEKYRRLVDNANEAILVTQDGWLKFVNRMALDLSGYSEQELTSSPFSEFIHPDDRGRVMERHLRRLQGDVFESKYMFRLMIRDGSAKWVEIGTVLIDWAGRPATLSFLSDISARKQAESQREAALEALRQSEARAKSMLQAIPDLMFRMNRQGVFLDYKANINDLYAQSEPTLIGQRNRDIAPPEFADLIDRQIDATLKTGTLQIFEYQLSIPGRGVRDYEARMVASGADEVMTIVRDITDRKQAESQREAALEALRESEERLAHIIDFLPDATLVIDREGKVIAWNRAVEEMTGISKNEMRGQTGFAHAVPFYGKTRPILIDLIFKDRHEIEKEYDFVSRKGDQLTAEVFAPLLYHGQGAYLWGTAAPLYDSSGHVVGAIESIRDITERKCAESQREAAHAALRESNAELQIRNEELDVFAHMVAHDLKTPLGAIMGYAELLTETYDTLSTEAILQTLNSINRVGRKAGSIIESLFVLASVRKQDVPAAPLDMAHIVAEAALRLADSIQDSGADLRVANPASWPVALGHAPWVEEIWVNYLSNALKYGGPRPRIDLGAARQPDGLIRFSVRDHGAGLTPEQQQRLFAPFERLAQAQVEGYGLGLSVVRHITEKLGGQVGVDSTPGQGSTFYFTLPAAPDR
jgi:PAS domain S-box-containing protein